MPGYGSDFGHASRWRVRMGRVPGIASGSAKHAYPIGHDGRGSHLRTQVETWGSQDEAPPRLSPSTGAKAATGIPNAEPHPNFVLEVVVGEVGYRALLDGTARRPCPTTGWHSGGGLRAIERSPVDFAAVKRPHDGTAWRLFAPLAGAFQAAMPLASSMVTQYVVHRQRSGVPALYWVSANKRPVRLRSGQALRCGVWTGDRGKLCRNRCYAKPCSRA